jgi:hypothetical protein
VEPQPGHPHDAVLGQDLGVGLALAYTSETTFVAIEAKDLAPGAVSKIVYERAKELGAANLQSIEMSEVARVDLNGDRKPEVLISAHTSRDSSDPYSGKVGDLESIFVITSPNGQPQILDQVAKILEADEAKAGRPHINLIALAQDPATKGWTLLMSQDLQRWEDETSTVEVAIGGKTTRQTATERRLMRTTFAAVYTLEGEKLTRVQGLGYRLLSF